jgi:hypothetical protein
MPKRIVWTGQAKADVRGIEQPIAIQILKTLGTTSSPAKARPNRYRALPHR